MGLTGCEPRPHLVSGVQGLEWKTRVLTGTLEGPWKGTLRVCVLKKLIWQERVGCHRESIRLELHRGCRNIACQEENQRLFISFLCLAAGNSFATQIPELVCNTMWCGQLGRGNSIGIRSRTGMFQKRYV